MKYKDIDLTEGILLEDVGGTGSRGLSGQVEKVSYEIQFGDQTWEEILNLNII